MKNNTIAAVSTPRGKGGVALLRVSGSEAVQIADRIFAPKNGKQLSEIPARTAVYGTIYIKEANGDLTPVDDALATVFRAPASFTGEDTVEICCHGGVLLTETVLTALLAAGASPAGAGEFTKRAFLNGKIGLSSAEALADLLEAQNRQQLLLAHSGMGGKTEEKSAEIYAELRRILASVYVVIDYPDEDLADMSREEMIAGFSECLAKLKALAETYRTGHAVAEGIATVICGRPNVGKSSLYNALVGRDAAIVTDIEGTTRDLLTETVSLGTVTLRLTDTAGLRETANVVEKIGVERAKKAMETAELILAVLDANAAITNEDRAILEEAKGVGKPVVILLNKTDLGVCAATLAECKSSCQNVVLLSAKTGEGFKELSEIVEQLFTDDSLSLENDAILTNARQQAAVLRAIEDVERAEKALADGLPIDLCCNDAEAAMASLAELDGRAVSEDLVSEIFSHFCVGK